ncbi:MAG: class I lanthipeptide [Dinghuibacter sp.]|nr:class I lanthipeptide [Dinghuibacter sp.]
MKKTSKKLTLKKVTITFLANGESKALAGGITGTCNCGTTAMSALCLPTQNGCSNNSCQFGCHEN